MSNITTATFNGEKREALTCPLYQYDYGQILQIVGLDLPASYQVHFANNESQGEAAIVLGNEDGVAIPNEYLATGKDVYAFIFLNTGADDGETEYVIHIPVIRRPVPEEYEPTPEEENIVQQLLGAVGELGTEVADLKEDIEQLDGLSDDIKLALLNLAQKVSYIDDDDGAEAYQTLYDALYPPAELVSISAVYTQSGVIYDTDTLDDLKPNLVVTATYEDSTTAVVTSYTLSGTLTTGTSTITVSYGGKTTTFTVTVTHDDRADWDYIWDYTEGLPPASDWTWGTAGGSGQIHSVVDDGVLIAAKNGTQAWYYASYASPQFLSANGGIAEFNFYIPSDGAGISNTTNADYFVAFVGNGTNGLRVEFTHPKNTSGSRPVILRTMSSQYDASNVLLSSQWDFDTQYKLRLEIDTSDAEALTGKIYLNDTLLKDNIDLTTVLYATATGMRTEGVTVNSTAQGFVIQSVKFKYGLS